MALTELKIVGNPPLEFVVGLFYKFIATNRVIHVFYGNAGWDGCGPIYIFE